MNQTFPKSIRVFRKHGHTIYWGNAIEVLCSHVDDRSIDFIFADAPYNIDKLFANFTDKWASDDEYAEWCYSWIDLCVEKLTSSGSMYVMASTQSMSYIELYLRKQLTILSRIVWRYDSSGVQSRK